MTTTDSRDGFATHAERAAADKLALPVIGWAGLGLAVLTLACVVTALWPMRSAGPTWFFLLFGIGHVLGWWFVRPKRDSPRAYTYIAWLRLGQVAIYLVAWAGVGLRHAGLLQQGEDWSTLDGIIAPLLITFFAVGPVLACASLALTRRGWIFWITEWGGPFVFAVLLTSE